MQQVGTRKLSFRRTRWPCVAQGRGTVVEHPDHVSPLAGAAGILGSGLAVRGAMTASVPKCCLHFQSFFCRSRGRMLKVHHMWHRLWACNQKILHARGACNIVLCTVPPAALSVYTRLVCTYSCSLPL